MGGVDEGVGGVRVDLEAEVVAEGLAHGGDRGDVLARLDLQLDPGVPLLEVVPDDPDGLLDGVLDAHGHPRGHGIDDPAEIGLEGLAVELEPRVDDGHLERGLRHRVADDMAQMPADGLGGEVVDVEEDRSEPAAGDVDACGHILGGVERGDHRHRFAPPGDLSSIRVERRLDEVAVLLGLPHERGLERGDEGNGHLVEGDRDELHRPGSCFAVGTVEPDHQLRAPHVIGSQRSRSLVRWAEEATRPKGPTMNDYLRSLTARKQKWFGLKLPIKAALAAPVLHPLMRAVAPRVRGIKVGRLPAPDRPHRGGRSCRGGDFVLVDPFRARSPRSSTGARVGAPNLRTRSPSTSWSS